MKTLSSKRLLWIDLEKGVAIIAVVIGHLFGLTYLNPAISGYVDFSVTLFIIVAGYNSALALANYHISSKKSGWQYFWIRLKKILIPYFIATLIYHVYSSGYEFVLPKFLEKLYLFNSRPAFYFIAVYIQLLIVAPLITKSILKKKLLFQIAFLMVIYYLSIVFSTRTYMFDLWGGGKNLLGGTYLFAFTFGVFLFDKLKSIKRNQLYLVLGVTALLVFLFTNGEMYNGTFSNPPNNGLLLYSLIIFLIIFQIGSYFEKTIFSTVLKPLAFLGRYSLYVYLYHTMAIEITTEVFIKKGWIDKSIQSYFYFFFALLAPVLTVSAFRLLTKLTKIKNGNHTTR